MYRDEAYTSFVQIRGTLPVFWDQSSTPVRMTVYKDLLLCWNVLPCLCRVGQASHCQEDLNVVIVLSRGLFIICIAVLVIADPMCVCVCVYVCVCVCVCVCVHRHCARLVERYGQQMFINLLGSRGSDQLLAEAYQV